MGQALPTRTQFQLSELPEIVDRRRRSAFGVGRLGKDRVVMKSAVKGYSRWRSLVNLRDFTVLGLI